MLIPKNCMKAVSTSSPSPELCDYVSNERLRSRYADRLEAAGYQVVSLDEGIYSLDLGNGVVVVPDAYLISQKDKEHPPVLLCLMLCSHSRISYEEFECMRRFNDKHKRIRLKVVWESNIEEELSYYEEQGRFKRSFGRLFYKGKESLYALDQDDLALFSLTHSRQEVIEHYRVARRDEKIIYDHLRRMNKTRKDILLSSGAPALYQTLTQEDFPDGWDELVDFGRCGDNRSVFQLWRTATDNEMEDLLVRQVMWSTYDLNNEVRKQLLPYMERMGFIENWISSPYGLIYLHVNSDIAIPDFVRFTGDTKAFVFLIGETPRTHQANSDPFSMFEEFRENYIDSGTSTMIGIVQENAPVLMEKLDINNITNADWKRVICGCRCSDVIAARNKQLKPATDISWQRRNEQLKTQGDHTKHFAAILNKKADHTSDELLFYPEIGSARLSDFDGLLKAPIAIAPDRDGCLSSSPFVVEYERYEANDELRKNLVGYIERIGGCMNRFGNGLGLAYVKTNDDRYIVPDFLIPEAGKLTLVKIFDTDRDDKDYFDRVVAITKRTISNRKTVRLCSLWSGYQMGIIQRDIANDQFDWHCHRTEYRGHGNPIWDMLNDPDLSEYRYQHGKQVVCEHYGVSMSQLDHLNRVYGLF